MRRNGHIRMDAAPIDRGASRRLENIETIAIDLISEPRDAISHVGANLNSRRDDSDEFHNFIVLRWGQFMKLGPLVVRSRVDAVEREEVEVNVAIERVAEALNKCDGATLRLSESQKFSRAPAQVTEYRS